jgi:hypothetical protein
MEEQAAGGLPGSQLAPEGGPGWGWRAVGATVLLTVAATFVLLLAARFVVAALGVEAGESLVSPPVYVVGVGVYLAILAGIYLFAARRAGWGALGVRTTASANLLIVPPLFVVGVIALLAVNGALALALGSFENPQAASITGGQPLGAGELAAGLLLIAGLVPLVEELFFRGMVYPLIRARMGALPAVALNALLFALVHFIPLLIPGLFVVGMLLAYLRERSGSIWPSVLYHMLQNSLALIAINAALALPAT